MQGCAGSSSSQLTLLSWSSTTGRATDGKYLFWADVFFRHRKDNPKIRSIGMVNIDHFRQFTCRPLVKQCSNWCLAHKNGRGAFLAPRMNLTPQTLVLSSLLVVCCASRR